MAGFTWNKATGVIAENAVRQQVGRGGFLALAQKAKTLMEPYVPMDTGALVESAEIEAEELKGRVIYRADYAAAVYYGSGLSFNRHKHPLATAFWDREVF